MYKLSFNFYRSLLLLLDMHVPSQLTYHVHSNGGKPCSINIVLPTPLMTTDILH